MIHFTYQEIIFSIIVAILWGFFFAVLHSIGRIVSFLPDIMSAIIRNDKHNRVDDLYGKSLGCINTTVGFITYTIGLVIISYISLDGVIRLYIILLSVIMFILTKKLAFSCTYFLFYLPLRILLLPFTIYWRKKHI